MASIKPYLNMAGAGFIGNAIPGILKGAICSFITEKQITYRDLAMLVQQDIDLWAKYIAPHKEKIMRVAPYARPYDWFDRDWLIDAVREKHPAIASLFLAWPEGGAWLDKQVKILKANLGDQVVKNNGSRPRAPKREKPSS